MNCLYLRELVRRTKKITQALRISEDTRVKINMASEQIVILVHLFSQESKATTSKMSISNLLSKLYLTQMWKQLVKEVWEDQKKSEQSDQSTGLGRQVSRDRKARDTCGILSMIWVHKGQLAERPMGSWYLCILTVSVGLYPSTQWSTFSG